jgi:hypothetical protein
MLENILTIIAVLLIGAFVGAGIVIAILYNGLDKD